MVSGDSHLTEETVQREELLRGRFLHVLRDTVRLPDGGSDTREYIVHPGAVMVVPLLDDGRVVLERQYRHPMGRVMVEFPAGKLDAFEDTWACGRRELLEETGYTAREWAKAGVLHPVISYSTEFIEIWFARGLALQERHLDAGEFLEVFSASVDQLLAWCRDGTVTDAKTLSAALWLQNWRAGAWDLQWQPSPDAAGAGQSGP
ncbi:NUDIX domain-containing protein [Pseudorhodoferax sp. Leaf274]|uniref:NUDIX domain-containing protein n=1 Tax=Pseudorhodoferax sp. Leaf274 TaxID=1736318 RepID=UPI000702D397|nr:NUDIX hydrolase [Pseudorhodoferax sp. Leaf274]KQP45567.1 ADP-ribose pyrophosphatase [Pseudorhodoferax sp. Leaf274]